MPSKEQITTLRGIKSETLSALDRIVEEENYASRNELISEILDRYVTDRSSFVLNNLPIVVRSMVDQEIKRLSEASREVLNDNYRIYVRMIRIIQKLENFLYPELPKADLEDLNTQQLLAIMDAMEKEYGLDTDGDF